MNPFKRPEVSPQNALKVWLAAATHGLTEESRARVVEEITSHFEQQVEAEIAAGASVDEAHRVALAALGSSSAARIRFGRSYLLSVEERILAGLHGKSFCTIPYLPIPSWTAWFIIVFYAFSNYWLCFFTAFAAYTWGRLVLRSFGQQRMREVCCAIAAIQILVLLASISVGYQNYEQIFTLKLYWAVFFVVNLLVQVDWIYRWYRLAMKLPKSATGVKS